MPIAEIQSHKYILVVDDLPDNQYLLQLVLEQEGHKVVTVSDGKTALEQIEKLAPSLILLDVMMPEMNGYELTKLIRANPNLPFIPILLISAHQKSSVVEGLDAGADEFIRKPFQVDELQARVRSLLRLKETMDQRENFVSCLTHDLRTPLVATDRMLSLIKKGCFGETSPQINEALDNVMTSNKNLLEMLNNLLEVYGHEVGQKFFSFTSFDFWELIEEVTTEFSPLAKQKGLDLTSHQLTNVTEITGDRLELRRVISNLLSNAIKFTDQGSVQIRLKFFPKTTDKFSSDMFVLEVEDTGIGITPENQKKIFDRFIQGHHKRSGHGLGLNLCYKIIQSHQGQIEVISKRGKGSIFKVSLPIKHD